MMKKLYTILFLTLTCTALQAQVSSYHNQWASGNGDYLWSNNSNWAGDAPLAGEQVAIYNAPNAEKIIVNASQTINIITMISGVDKDFAFAKRDAEPGIDGEITLDILADAGFSPSATPGIWNISNVGGTPHTLTFHCNVNIENSFAPSVAWKGVTNFKIENTAGNAITFASGSTLNLGGTGNTGLLGANNFQFNFNGTITGDKDLLFGTNTTSVFGATSENSAHTGKFTLSGGADITVNTFMPQIFNNTTIESNGTGSIITVNNPGVLRGDILMDNDADRSLTIEINGDQEFMHYIEMKRSGTHTLTFVLPVDGSVDHVNFWAQSFKNWNVSGTNTINIENFKEGVFKFGPNNTGITAGQLSQIHVISGVGAGEALALDTDGTLWLASTLSTKEVAAFEFSIYPNPAQDRINIQSQEQIKSIHLYDMLGRLVKEEKELSNSVDITTLNTGFYMLKLETEDGLTATKKIIKK